jgi:hypothetical protein
LNARTRVGEKTGWARHCVETLRVPSVNGRDRNSCTRICKTAPPPLEYGGSLSQSFPALHPTSAALLPPTPSAAGRQCPLNSVTHGTLPETDETLPPPVPLLPAAASLLPAGGRTLPAVFRPLLGTREHGPRARDSVVVMTTTVGRLVARRLRQAAPTRTPGVSGERRPAAAQQR